MAVIILPERDNGERAHGAALADAVLDAAPEAVCRILRGGVGGVETSDAAAAAYLTTIHTATGHQGKG